MDGARVSLPLQYVDHSIIKEIEASGTICIEINKQDQFIDETALTRAANRIWNWG